MLKLENLLNVQYSFRIFARDILCVKQSVISVMQVQLQLNFLLQKRTTNCFNFSHKHFESASRKQGNVPQNF